MKPERWKHLQDVYFRALELPADRRRLFLDTTCRGDVSMRQEVESLLNYEDKVDGFLEAIPSDVLAAMDSEETDETFVSDDFIGEVVDGRYLVAERVGAGGMGVVYRADHRLLGTPVAIKRLSAQFRDKKEYRRQAVAEAQRAIQLDHENVARVKDVVEASNEVLVVMEFIDGQTLKEHVEHQTPLNDFLSIAIQCASALKAAHQKRIAHLDIKPANIMLTSSGQVKICDFGIARQLPSPEGHGAEEVRWTFSGTPAYMAPEVLEGNQFDVSADIFSLGVVFYELLAGKHPFRTPDVRSTTNRILKEPPDPPLREIRKKLPARLLRLIDRMLVKEPSKRLTASETLHELRAMQLREKIVREVWRVPSDVLPLMRRKPVLAFSLIAVMGILVAAGWYLSPLLIAGIFSLPEDKQVVVLPFRVSPNSDKHSYARGISEMLASRLMELTSVPHLRIEPPNSVRERNIDTVQKARVETNATLVVDGSFEFNGAQAMFSYYLIRTTDGKQVRWGTVKTANSEDFTFVDDIIQKVAADLDIILAPEKGSGAANSRAFSLYRDGMGFLSRYHNPENLDAAVQHFSQAVESDPNFAQAYAALGQAYLYKFQEKNQELSLLDQALDACRKADSLFGGNSDAEVCLGRVYLERGDRETAIPHFRKAITYSASNDTAFQALGRALEESDRFDEAEKEYLRAINLRQDYWGPQAWIAAFYDQSRHDYTKALEHYSAALSVSQDNARVHYSIASAFANLGQYDMAERSVLRSASLRPWAPRPNSNLGLVYLMWGRYDDALREFTKAFELERPGDLDTNYRITGNLARIYQLTNQTEKARAMYELAINQGKDKLQIDSRDHKVHILFGRYYAMLGNAAEAKNHLAFALKARPRDAHYLMIAATAYVAMKETDNALSCMERAVALGYTDVQIHAERELDALRNQPRYIELMSSLQKAR